MYTFLHVHIFVTLHVVTHYSWIHILCIVSILLYVYLAGIIIMHAQHNSMVMLHMRICMFISITCQAPSLSRFVGFPARARGV